MFMKYWYRIAIVMTPSGILCEPPEYAEVSYVCSDPKSGISSVEIDYEHIRHTGPPL